MFSKSDDKISVINQLEASSGNENAYKTIVADSLSPLILIQENFSYENITFAKKLQSKSSQCDERK